MNKFFDHRKDLTIKTKTILAATLAAMLLLTSVRAAEITPAETKAIAEEAFILMAMRLYWPKEEALEGTWTAPPLKRVD